MTSRYGVTKAVRKSLLATLLLPGLALAEPVLDLQYSTFYSQMKTFAKGEFGHARLGFYLTDPQNGRFARTIVNRLWHRLMGRGVVHPLDAMQSEPWNEDLLDYLANALVEHDYDLKAILRLIATSQAYQSTTHITTESASVTDYVYDGPIARRLTAEQFLDAVWQLTDAAPTAIAAPVFRYDLSQVDLAAIEVSGQWVWGQLVDNQAPADESLLIRGELT